MQILSAFVSESEPAENREILREHIGQPPIDQPIPGHQPVARNHLFIQSELARAMRHQLIDLLEGAFIQQQIDALARGKLAFFVLPLPPRRPAALFGRFVPAPQFRNSCHRL